MIVHPEVAEDNLSLAELRRILTGDREFWTSGARVTIFIRAPVARERDAIVRDICQMTEAQFRSALDRQGVPRRDAERAEDRLLERSALEQVGRTPGAIGLRAGRRSRAKNVKVIRIDGRAPGQTGYRLR